MKLLLLLIIAASMLIEGFVNADGYIRNGKGCWVRCPLRVDCNKLCKQHGGYYGYCYNLGCWCEGLPEKEAYKRGRGSGCWK
uniref:Putative depressant toxin Tx695 n=1 Tax=Buthus israelis TaxID=2899555 RepID=B8XH19_BUTIS|nr:putative depressant toxin Tx695 [Buthus occitanus israelis]